MHGYDYDFAARMAAGKQRAQDRRNRGLSSGKGYGVKRHYHEAEPEGLERAIEEIWLEYRSHCENLREDWLRLAYPERYEGFTLGETF